MIQINKTKDKVILSITTQLDIEDVKDLILDLQDWVLETDPPKFKGISEEKTKEALDYSKQKYDEAKAQNESKNKLAEEMRRCFVDLLDSEYIKKELTAYQLDPKTKEVIVKTKILKDERRNKRD